ncbi:MAG: HAMP domain-containing sensor histidine kinase [Bacillota bacterium]|nr:HAMP domain-containing sensor histidine kinase [Bacillota bacterium]
MIKITRKKKFFLGVFLVLLGIIMPMILDISFFHIQEKIVYAIEKNKELNLVFAAITLVFVNTIRALPHYIGAFYISESISFKKESFLNKYIKQITVAVLVPIVYILIQYLYPTVTYHFGLPAITLIILISLLGSREYNYVSEWKKTFLIIFFIASVQFLDLTPSLSFLPFGRGETSSEIKLVSHFLGINRELDLITLIFFFIFIFFGSLLFLLIKDENQLRLVDQLRKENIMLESEAKIKDIENRSNQEVKALVHDLKSPLTSAQALIGLVKFSCQQKEMAEEEEYLNIVEDSIDSLSKMISEILSEDAKFLISTEELINGALANISKNPMAKVIHTINNVPEKCVKVNKITFTRAIVNILENSFRAIKDLDYGKIEIVVDAVDLAGEKSIEISIIDNGVGIDQKYNNKVWESGFTRNESYGLGLNFVKRTVEKLNGEVFFYSKKNEGTTVTIILGEEELNG